MENDGNNPFEYRDLNKNLEVPHSPFTPEPNHQTQKASSIPEPLDISDTPDIFENSSIPHPLSPISETPGTNYSAKDAKANGSFDFVDMSADEEDAKTVLEAPKPDITNVDGLAVLDLPVPNNLFAEPSDTSSLNSSSSKRSNGPLKRAKSAITKFFGIKGGRKGSYDLGKDRKRSDSAAPVINNDNVEQNGEPSNFLEANN